MMLKKLITIGALILCLISPTTVKAEELKENVRNSKQWIKY